MPERTAVIGSSVGLHARPATLFVQAVVGTGLPVTIAKEGGSAVDARSVLTVMSLGAKGGETVVLSADGDDADARLGELAALLERDLDAE
ncbi:HPr family phosphocarrier protein [Nocardiopsis mangrovi]|uniref:Phosphocarrier protein HPr n=1 Tax=Nocardiopsis mangrovi TaxID=1179818 RepID=A0ABV9E3E1_9ACTN